MKLVILDRDGVINYECAHFIKTPEEWRPIPGSLEAIAALNQAGYRAIVVTNQSGIARGLFDMTTLNEIHKKMIQELHRMGGHIEAIYFCPHTNEANCSCRKPKPGLFLEIQRRYHINLADVPAIGDSLRDLLAAKSAGAQPVLVITGNGQKTFNNGGFPENTQHYDSLAQAVQALLSQSS